MKVFLRLHRAVLSIAQLHATPLELFTACVVGAIIGCTPLYGLHFFVCAAVASFFRLNVIATYAAANISIPPLAPFVAAACMAVGGALVYGNAMLIDPSELTALSPLSLAPRLLVAWLAGAPVVGAAVGVIAGAVVASVAHRHRRRRDPTTAALDETIARYASAPRGLRKYVLWKARLDPVYRTLATELPVRGTIVDLGTGLGTVPILLALLSSERVVVGVEWDERKADTGRIAAAGLRVTIDIGDVRTWEIPPCEAITIVDVLHYFVVEDQRELLGRARAALRSGGCLLVREVDSAQRSVTTRFLENMAVRIGWNRATRNHFRAAADLVEDLVQLGFTVETRQVSGAFQPGNVLLRATVAPAAGEPVPG